MLFSMLQLKSLNLQINNGKIQLLLLLPFYNTKRIFNDLMNKKNLDILLIGEQC